jgi:hypothetical protein
MGCPTSISSGTLTPGTNLVFTGRHTLNAVLIQPGATVHVHDNVSAAGPIVFSYVNAGTSTESVVLYNALRLNTGLTVVNAGGDVQVLYGA